MGAGAGALLAGVDGDGAAAGLTGGFGGVAAGTSAFFGLTTAEDADGFCCLLRDAACITCDMGKQVREMCSNEALSGDQQIGRIIMCFAARTSRYSKLNNEFCKESDNAARARNSDILKNRRKLRIAKIAIGHPKSRGQRAQRGFTQQRAQMDIDTPDTFLSYAVRLSHRAQRRKHQPPPQRKWNYVYGQWRCYVQWKSRL